MIIQDTMEGIRYLYSGQKLFFQDRSLWKYALLPILFMIGIYLGFIAVTFFWIYPVLKKTVSSLTERYLMSFPIAPSVIGFFVTMTVLLIIWLSLGILYQCFAAFTFDSLSEAFEEKYFNYKGEEGHNSIPMIVDGIYLSSRNALFYAGLLLLSMCLPGLGHIVCMIFLGYLTGISSIQACAVNHGIRSKQILEDSSRHFTLLSVAGVIPVLFGLLPIAQFLLAPGFIVGGCLIYNEKVLGNKITIST